MSILARKTVGALWLLTLLFTINIGVVEAGFGITPPYVSNSSLTRNSVYEQQILLVRGDPDVAQNAEITIDAPEIESWIEIVEGETILLPAGVQKVPMTVRVRVPSDAEFKDHIGAIRIRTVPADGVVTPGAVSISLGALVDIKLSVIDKVIKDFRIRKISVADLNEGSKFAWLYFPGKIRFAMFLENTGNVDVSPSKVEFRIFDRSGKVMLEETRSLGKIPTIAPYGTGEVVAEIPTRLPAGGYMARYKIYNGDEIKQEGDLSLNILPPGSVQVAGFGFSGLSLSHKVSVLLPVFAVLIAGLYYAHIRRTRRRERL